MRDTNIRQEIAMSSRTPSKRRLYPSAFDSDFYMLSSLRKSLERAIVRYVDKGSLIFDYGCGDAPYRTLFQHSKYIAGDLMGNPQADIIIAPDGRVPYEDGKFDVILSSQVLEHVPYVENYLTEAYRLLKVEGFLILSTHGWWTHHPCPQDFWRWTREGLVRILRQNGFNIIDSNWLIGMLAYSYQLRVQCWKGVQEQRNVPAKIIFRLISACYQQLMRFADGITPDHIGRDKAPIYFIVAQKCKPSGVSCCQDNLNFKY